MCRCADFNDLEFLRKQISRRIKESKDLRKAMDLIAEHPGKEHKLYRCKDCEQLWQGSRAWNWGNELYLFKVPDIVESEWLSEVYVQPDELMMFAASVGGFLKRNSFSESDKACASDLCEHSALVGLSHCLKHHVSSLQQHSLLHSNPIGRWFRPYLRENVVPAL